MLRVKNLNAFLGKALLAFHSPVFLKKGIHTQAHKINKYICRKKSKNRRKTPVSANASKKICNSYLVKKNQINMKFLFNSFLDAYYFGLQKL